MLRCADCGVLGVRVGDSAAKLISDLHDAAGCREGDREQDPMEEFHKFLLLCVVEKDELWDHMAGQLVESPSQRVN